LERADKHIVEFQLAYADFFESRLQEFREKPNAKGIYQHRMVLTGPLPRDLNCAVGDAIHNLRSALDHVAYNAALRNNVKGSGLREIYFTIRKTPEAFDAALREGVVTQIGPRWIAYLRSVEPYNGGCGHDLCAIDILDKLDKHRELIRVTPYADIIEMANGSATMIATGIPLKKGEEVAIQPAGDYADPETYAYLRASVTFDDIDAPGVDPLEPAENALIRFSDSVRLVIDEAERVVFS
jgi:hypothetical protein